MKNISLLLLLVIIISTSCTSKKPESEETIYQEETIKIEEIEEAFEIPDLPESSKNYQGVYKGKITCYDCNGIETELTLIGNSFKRFTSHSLASQMPYIEEGSFSWEENGSIINLGKKTSLPIFYLVEENGLYELDSEKKKYKQNHKNNYRLEKLSAASN